MPLISIDSGFNRQRCVLWAWGGREKGFRAVLGKGGMRVWLCGDKGWGCGPRV